jgi:metal-responsive CopG/Arc/MetJ family transcriptional regulator
MANKTKKPRKAARAKGMTQISLSMPSELVARIDKMADAENRNRSNFIAKTMATLADAR